MRMKSSWLKGEDEGNRSNLGVPGYQIKTLPLREEPRESHDNSNVSLSFEISIASRASPAFFSQTSFFILDYDYELGVGLDQVAGAFYLILLFHAPTSGGGPSPTQGDMSV